VSRQSSFQLPGGRRLRPWRADDAAGLMLAMRDPLVRHYAGLLHDDRAQALRSVQRWATSWADGDGAAWAISGPGRGVVGSVRFGVLDAELGSGSVGYWLSPESRGQGVASAAVRAGTRAVIDGLGWHRIELYHAVENGRSCAVARRCGYRYEGLLRQAMQYPVDGRWSDEHLHARLAGDPDPT
jgi:ribosomal-protein-alanine N-acetyltransferase